MGKLTSFTPNILISKTEVFFLLQATPSLLQLLSVRTDSYTPKVLVISPLISLISDNISKVEQLDLGTAVNLATASKSEVVAADFLFTTPETLLDGKGREYLADRDISNNISLICVDECHVIKS